MSGQGRKLLNTANAADYLDMPLSRLAKLRHFGGGPVFMKSGQRIYYDREDLDAWIEAHKRTSTSDIGQPEAAA